MWEPEPRLMGDVGREGLFSRRIVSGVYFDRCKAQMCLAGSICSICGVFFGLGFNDVEQIILKDILDAPLQARLCNNMQKARELWDNIMTKGNAKYANMWLEYYNLER